MNKLGANRFFNFHNHSYYICLILKFINIDLNEMILKRRQFRLYNIRKYIAEDQFLYILYSSINVYVLNIDKRCVT